MFRLARYDQEESVLEAGYETPGRPAVLLLHGFPELAYSWRHVMLPLAEAGYHVIAPDSAATGGPPVGTTATMATWRQGEESPSGSNQTSLKKELRPR